MHWQSAANQVRKWLLWRKNEGRSPLCQPNLSRQVFCRVNNHHQESVTCYTPERKPLSSIFKELTTFCTDVKTDFFYTFWFVCLVYCNCVCCEGFNFNFCIPQSRLYPQAVPHFNSPSFTIQVHFSFFLSLHPVLQYQSSGIQRQMVLLSVFRDGHCFWNPVHSCVAFLCSHLNCVIFLKLLFIAVFTLEVF